MSDDSFIREVNEEIRREQAQKLWDRFGPALLGAAILIVLATAAVVGYRYWDETRANRSGDAFSAALKLANDGKNDEAIAALDQLEKDGYGAYPLLARMRAATVKADKGDVDAAVKDFDEVGADSAIPAGIRDMARLRAALLLVDHGSFADVSSRVEALTADTNPLRSSAREALGLAAWKEGKSADALKLFDQIASDDGAPRNARQRAQLMAELIRGSGNAS
ncbi:MULTISPECIES: tetratricopeptide repeat protein [unclassified Mesorhizobium]|uniref:tetratricopeptide repeat protein n=1 Tax=unclassified Mesorhizobium TaxID=325217 RepID=UPI000FCBEEF8|nr:MULTISPECIES: tetratricopeptide repeat protein [unclassified Mesorhizobium]TIT78179.1 MAG: tetratricopeptide repeat protein [Mesorhizobium sp.]TGP22812.1 tetratricopeptide repeat protein [Mesorhizobium sp. M1D.F.Ca.ET.231.01.1.1]TGP31211.1 tetratricopeptide repeat protein [Mesorhizobium sp. M1D.F.Ca.ET.234.01.1.1]TGS45513.1 tetratricopeptide repeat protein [Mesorhizobium sp. M1D.F.Ca.ET.184.01.1.1]TGS60988.1 tetratricopeptide repeat protein [Mesorhizobium sp. M1D.F.Ca.ET.183.01.1.1]